MDLSMATDSPVYNRLQSVFYRLPFMYDLWATATATDRNSGQPDRKSGCLQSIFRSGPVQFLVYMTGLSNTRFSEETTDEEEEPQTATEAFFPMFAMAATTNPKEIKIKTPVEFKGDKEKATKFLKEVELYLHLNQQLYDTNERKIGFALSFMTDGSASAWKEAYIQDKAVLTGGFNFGTWLDFVKVFKEGFTPINEAGNAHLKLKGFKQGERDVKDYISDFRIYAAKSGSTSDEVLSEYFMDGLHPRLLEKVFNMEKLPVRISEWFTAASKYNAQWRHVHAIVGKIRKETPAIQKQNYPTSTSTFFKDPN